MQTHKPIHPSIQPPYHYIKSCHITSLTLHRLLLLPLLCLELLSCALGFLSNAFDPLHSLSLFIHVAALQDTLHDLSRVDRCKVVFSNLLVNAHCFGRRVGIESERHEAGWAMIHCIWRPPWRRREIRLGGRERCAKDD